MYHIIFYYAQRIIVFSNYMVNYRKLLFVLLFMYLITAKRHSWDNNRQILNKCLHLRISLGRAHQMAKPVKVPASRTDNLSLISSLIRRKDKTDACKFQSNLLTYAVAHEQRAYTLPNMYTYIQTNKVFNFLK